MMAIETYKITKLNVNLAIRDIAKLNLRMEAPWRAAEETCKNEHMKMYKLNCSGNTI